MLKVIINSFFLLIFSVSVFSQDDFNHRFRDVNYTKKEQYDIEGKSISKEITFFNNLGKHFQTQSLDLKTGKVWTVETRYDTIGRAVLSTFLAPIGFKFEIRSDFILKNNDQIFLLSDLGTLKSDGTIVEPASIGIKPNSLGAYTSQTNSDNLYQDVTDRPYTRTFYDELNPGKVLKIIGGNKIDTDSDGIPDSYPQGFTHTMPATQELYYVFEKDSLNYEQSGVNINGNLVNPKIQKTITIDSHGEEIVSFAYDDGRILATARSGQASDTRLNTLNLKKRVTSLIGEQGYVDIHIPKGCDNSATFLGDVSNYKVFDLKTSAELTSFTNLNAGIYRIEAKNKTDLNSLTYIENGHIKPVSSTAKGVTYDINYYDYSLNYYDDAGNLTSSLQPLGFNNKEYAKYNLTGEVKHIDENLKSTFKYNSLGQLLETESPDEGRAQFDYRKDGQIRFSQNTKQYFNLEFSYTNYDKRARPVESGVYKQNGEFNQFRAPGILNLIDETLTYEDYINDNDGLKDQYCKEQHFTRYDTPDIEGLSNAFATDNRLSNYQYQSFVAGNVSCTHTKNPETTTTWYSYDIYGRVKWIVQKINGIEKPVTIDYEYDDVTGAVNKVYYQKGVSEEQFIHKYTYNQNDYALEKVETSENGQNYTTHAEYEYYETGELKRTILAEGLQGIDYVYNLNGALKAINHPSLDPTKDPGKDNGTNGTAQPDVFGMQIDYYKGDYTRKGTHINTSNVGQDQYNGNIKAIRWNNDAIDGEDLTTEKTYAYSYDRNNWLTSAKFGSNKVGEAEKENEVIIDQDITTDINATESITIAGNSLIVPGVNLNIVGFKPNINQDYSINNLTYDANGNIQSLKRNKNTEDGQNSMDDLSYVYDTTKPNQLKQVLDAVTRETNADDIKTQITNNYEYNSIGQLVKNNTENIEYLYTASGLVSEVKKGTNPVVKFFYNDRNQRVRKESYNPETGVLIATQYYVRDAAGTPMAIYRNGTLVEHTVYGASRLGVYKRQNAKTTYELTDHLGNVRALIEKDDPVIKGTDYYPFGMPMPLRNSLSDYRYAFQGQEKDPETGKEAFELRLWDARIGRWLTTDPANQFSSPYLGMGNNPINGTDPDGGKFFTKFKLRGGSESDVVEVKDGIDKTIEVSATEFQQAKFFANELSGSGNFSFALYNENTASIREAYVNFYNSVNSYDSFSLSNVADYVFNFPDVKLIGEPIGSSGAYEFIGGPASGALKNSGRPLANFLGKTLKIQKHHIIPKAIFKKYPVLSNFLLRDGGANLKKLPTPFHGSHFQYNKYVGNKIEALIQGGNLNSKNLNLLSKDLNRAINKAYDSGLKLNDYFRQFN